MPGIQKIQRAEFDPERPRDQHSTLQGSNFSIMALLFSLLTQHFGFMRDNMKYLQNVQTYIVHGPNQATYVCFAAGLQNELLAVSFAGDLLGFELCFLHGLHGLGRQELQTTQTSWSFKTFTFHQKKIIMGSGIDPESWAEDIARRPTQIAGVVPKTCRQTRNIWLANC